MKKHKEMLFNGLGFPVLLVNPPMTTVRGEEILNLDFEKLQHAAFIALIRKPASFSGAEVKFIRHYMELSQNYFADLLGVERSSVANWEAKDLEWTKMGVPAEMMLRTKMVQHVSKNVDEEIALFEPGARKKDVGEPLELAAQA